MKLMLSLSYITAVAAMIIATLYLFFRVRLFLTTATMLIGSLLLIYGPAYLVFMLTSGAHVLPIRMVTGGISEINPIFPRIAARVQHFDAVVVAMNFSIALMYVGIIAGIEMVDRLFPKRAAALRVGLRNWNTQSLRDDEGSTVFLLGAIALVLVFMAATSIRENHVGKIMHFLSLSALDVGRIEYRLQHGGSPSYVYNVTLNAIAPMLTIWGLLAGWLKRSPPLLLAAGLLFVAVMIGKSETLAKAPAAFFLIQLLVAGLAIFSNRITWRIALGIAGAVTLLLFAVFKLILPPADVMESIYNRVFEVENQSLLENFAVFPALHPFMWGTNLRPIAMLAGIKPYVPTFSIVAYVWYGNYDVTSPALFIADAWAGFSFAGVIVLSLVAGTVCRSIDTIFLGRGKTVLAIAIIGAAFGGVFSLLTNALNIAMLSGGLLLSPALAGLLVMAERIFSKSKPPFATP
jgi:hypothetical protein